MQFLVKHNGSNRFLEKEDNFQEEIFSDDCRNAKWDRKHHAAPTHMRSDW